MCSSDLDPRSFEPSSWTGRILTRIGQERRGFLRRGQGEIVLDPESTKYVLHQTLAQEKIDLLFHVRTIGIVKQDPIRLRLSGREGTLEIDTRRLIDASEEYETFAFSKKRRRTLKKASVNFLTAGKIEIPSDFLSRASGFRRLDDGRYWVSFPIEPCEHSVEHLLHRHAQEWDDVLTGLGDRIQILPARAHMIYELEKGNQEEGQETVDDFLEREYREDGQLLKGFDLEKGQK